MQDLEPPEVPLELMSETSAIEPEKKGFFKKLFSKKPKPISSDASASTEINLDLDKTFSNIDLPKMSLPELELPPTLDVTNLDNVSIASPEFADSNSNNTLMLPSIEEQIKATTTAVKGKSKGKLKKGQKRKIEKKDVSSQFDWNREINDQEILIHDSNRFNQDVNTLIAQAEKYIDDKTTASDDFLASQHQDTARGLEELNISEMGKLTGPMPEISNDETPVVDETQHKMFMKMSMSHGKLKSMLEKYLHNKKLFSNKEKVMDLFKQYDENIEKIIEDKELELTKKKQYLTRLEKHLKAQETGLTQMHDYITDLNKKLKDREVKINEIIAESVQGELARRTKIEQKAWREELKKTVLMNNDLKKKVRIIENDRLRFNSEYQKMNDTAQKKLNGLQLMYEKKLKELDSEKKTFEIERKTFVERRKSALELIKKADTISAELTKVQQMQDYVSSGKKLVEKELSEDKELKHAIAQAELSLVQEKENLDNMVFDKYINNKLKNIKPEMMNKREDWKLALNSNPIYEKVNACRALLSQRNLTDAKAMYNIIRKEYEGLSVSKNEKEAIYTAIRELYNEIQLKIVEMQMRSR